MIEQVAVNRSFGGVQGVYRHASAQTKTEMIVSVFTPPSPTGAVLIFLSGLTCTHANVTEKGEFRAAAAKHGLTIVCPDTSPRGEGVPNDEAYDFGQGAGFYVDATQTPWSTHFRMESYITRELPALLAQHFPIDLKRCGITGHSMGGHGALTLALRHPELYKSVSAFAPIVAPSQVPWGRKAFAGYLGADESTWRNHDSVALIESGKRIPEPLIDVGTADTFLERELKPELLSAACARSGQPLTLRMQDGYDHSYYFISTFMADHIAWHAARL